MLVQASGLKLNVEQSSLGWVQTANCKETTKSADLLTLNEVA